MVYAKPPFAGPQQVLDYVGRYTHRVAIANQRLLDMDDGHVRFRYTDDRTRVSSGAIEMDAMAAGHPSGAQVAFVLASQGTRV